MTMLTQEDILEAIRKAVEAATEQGNEPGTVTTAEIQGVMDCGPERARGIGRQLVADGVLAPDRVRRTNMWGISQLVLGFRYVNGQDK